MKYVRMPIEIEAPEQLGYENIDCNLTESSYADFRFKELGINIDDLMVAYVDHKGHAGLRGLLAKEAGLNPDQVLITAGAAQALFILATTLIEAGDELLVVRPNYATNLETPRAIQASLKILDLTFENQWRIDPAEIEKAITPKTKLVSITVPHNPTGTLISKDDLNAIVEITRKKGCYLLVDETYREMNFQGVYPHAAKTGSHVISVASFSKTFGLPGIRIGWLMTQDAELYEKCFAAKEQIQICGSALDEEIAYQFYKKKDQFLGTILENLKRRFEILKSWMHHQQIMEWVEPSGGCIAFPRFTDLALSKMNLDVFYKRLNDGYNTHVGPGHWFELHKRHMRIGYGWPTDDQLLRGLKNIERAYQDSIVS